MSLLEAMIYEVRRQRIITDTRTKQKGNDPNILVTPRVAPQLKVSFRNLPRLASSHLLGMPNSDYPGFSSRYARGG